MYVLMQFRAKGNDKDIELIDYKKYAQRTIINSEKIIIQKWKKKQVDSTKGDWRVQHTTAGGRNNTSSKCKPQANVLTNLTFWWCRLSASIVDSTVVDSQIVRSLIGKQS